MPNISPNDTIADGDLPFVLGRYILHEQVGEGGFAKVYRAELQGPAGFRKRVAIKLIKPVASGSASQEQISELFHEARLGGLLNHRNCVNVFELGEVEGRYFIAMELIEGMSLQDLLALAVPPPPVALSIAIEICRGLAHAQKMTVGGERVGLVHRDLKPGNILVGSDGAVKVSDFGIARLASQCREHTEDRTVMGTPAYMSPQQARGEPLDKRSDLFSMGAVLVELFTGQRLFPGEDTTAILARVMNVDDRMSDPALLATLNALTPGLAAVCAKCLAPDPADRYPDARSLGEALSEFRRSAPSEPDLETWLADVLEQASCGWTGELSADRVSGANATIELDSGDDFDAALEGLKQATGLEDALHSLEVVEAMVLETPVSSKSLREDQLHEALMRCGFHCVRPGSVPCLVSDPNQGRFWMQGQQVIRFKPDSIAHRLLDALAVHGARLDRASLYERVWQNPYRPPSSDNALYVYLHRLRGKLKHSPVAIDQNGDGRYLLRGEPAVFHWQGASDSWPRTPPETPRANSEPVTGNLVHDLNPFVGREEEQRRIMALLSEGERLLTLTGPPGTGKSRLARQVALQHQRNGDVPGGGWVCPMESCTESTAVLSAVARILGVPLQREGDSGALTDRIGYALSARGPLLLILDNADRAMESLKNPVERWCTLAPEARVLVTSRSRFNRAGEKCVPLGPLSVSDGADSPAVALFVDRAKRAVDNFALQPDNTADILAIVQELDGNPLAIELAASRVNLMSPKRIRERLAQRFRLLKTESQDPNARRTTLQGAIDESWEALRPWEQSAMAQLSVFRGGFLLEAAEEVVQLNEWPDAPWVVDVVSALLNQSLVATTPTSGEPRFFLYNSIRAYAWERLAQNSTTMHEVAERHADCFARYGENTFLDGLYTFGSVERHQVLNSEHDNIRAAYDWACDHATRTAMQLSLALLAIVMRRGPLIAGHRLVQRTRQLPEPPQDVRAEFLFHAGILNYKSAKRVEARKFMEDALALTRALALPQRELRVMVRLAHVYRLARDLESAHQLLDAVAGLLETVHDAEVEGRRLAELGAILNDTGRHEEAPAYFQRAHDVFVACGCSAGVATMLCDLGRSASHRGNMTEASQVWRKALVAFRDEQNLAGEAGALQLLGIACQVSGDLQTGQQHCLAAIALHRRLGRRGDEALALQQLGSIQRDLGAWSEAQKSLERGIAIQEALSETGGAAHVLGALHGTLGELLEETNALDDAEMHLRKAIEFTEIQSANDLLPQFLGALGLVLARRGDMQQAQTHMERGETLSEAFGRNETRVELYTYRARMESLAENREKANAALDAARALASQLGLGPESIPTRRIEALQSTLDSAEKG